MKISVIMTSYNYAQYLQEAINSVLAQTYQDWELIIVDDGSVDNSVEIIQDFCQKDKRIKLFQHENSQNKGLKESLLLALGNANGKWIAFVESDDVLHPDNLIKKIDIINKNPNAALIFNKVSFLDENNTQKTFLKTELAKIQKELTKKEFPREMFFDFGIKNQILTFSCVMVDATTIKNADFDSPIDVFLDWWLWGHIAYNNKFYYLDEELTSWRLHPKSYVSTGKIPTINVFPLQIYIDIYKKNKKSLNILGFIIYLLPKLLFTKLSKFISKRIF